MGRCNITSQRFGCTRRGVCSLLLLYVLTFAVILPLALHRNKHSLYFIGDGKNSTTRVAENEKENNRNLDVAFKILRSLPSVVNISDTTRVLNRSRAGFYNLAVTIVTTSRNQDHHLGQYEPKYLTQSVAKYIELDSRKPKSGYQVTYKICNVDSKVHKEAEALAGYMRTVRVPGQTPADQFEKEKQDYMNCLNHSLSDAVDYILLVEDDAIPDSDLFMKLNHLITYRIRNKGNLGFVKLFHPHRLNGFWTTDLNRWIELLALCVTCEMLIHYLLWIFAGDRFTTRVVRLTIFLYFVLLFFLTGRINVSELRKAHPILYRLSPAPSCCVPAVLFDRAGAADMINYLSAQVCKKGYAKDTAMDKFGKATNRVSLFFEPNLFEHIGVYTTRRDFLVDPLFVNK